MKFSTRTRYGLRFLIYLANESGDRYVQLGEVSEKEEISQKYLEQIVRLLKPSGVLLSARGVSGGYQLAKRPEEVNLETLIKYLEGDLAPVTCLRPEGASHEKAHEKAHKKASENCERAKNCPTLPMWKELGEIICSYLAGKTLADMMMKS